MTEAETFYDEKIAPELKRLAELCDEQGINFVSSVEYEPGERAMTFGKTEPKSAAQFLAQTAANCRGNFDGLGIAMARSKYDTSACMLLNIGEQ